MNFNMRVYLMRRTYCKNELSHGGLFDERGAYCTNELQHGGLFDERGPIVEINFDIGA